MDDCIFCKIVNGEVPSEKILETENFIVIKDVNPKTEGHSLIIPKEHYKNLLDIPAYLNKEMLETAKNVSLKLMEETSSKGFNLMMNNNPVAGQVVMHAHLHILPRKEGDGFNTRV
jgi:histidine triad (HIT) family protein